MTEDMRAEDRREREARALVLMLRRYLWQGMAHLSTEGGKPVFRMRLGRMSDEMLRKVKTHESIINAAFTVDRHRAVTKARSVALMTSDLLPRNGAAVEKLQGIYSRLPYCPQDRAEILALVDEFRAVCPAGVPQADLLAAINSALGEGEFDD